MYRACLYKFNRTLKFTSHDCMDTWFVYNIFQDVEFFFRLAINETHLHVHVVSMYMCLIKYTCVKELSHFIIIFLKTSCVYYVNGQTSTCNQRTLPCYLFLPKNHWNSQIGPLVSFGNQIGVIMDWFYSQQVRFIG